MIRDVATAIMQQYELPVAGTHGVTHWARVYSIGRRLAQTTGADMQVVELFALFHDACRMNELRDDGHGRRGADLAAELRKQVVGLNDTQFDMLTYACSYHTEGFVDANVTVQTCWDSDRLDLLRCDIEPEPLRLCTHAAKTESMRSWANERARNRFIPEQILNHWGIVL